MALSCAWVDRIVPNVPYSIITEKLLDDNGCSQVAHGDDMIILPGKPHMYSEAQATGRFCMFPRTPGLRDSFTSCTYTHFMHIFFYTTPRYTRRAMSSRDADD